MNQRVEVLQKGMTIHHGKIYAVLFNSGKAGFPQSLSGNSTQLQLMIPSWLQEKSGAVVRQISSRSIIAHFGGGIGIFCTQ
jgi:hypothetical protein